MRNIRITFFKNKETEFGIFQIVVQGLVPWRYEVKDWPYVSLIYDQCFLIPMSL